MNRTNSRPGRCWLSAQGPSGVQIAEELLRAGRRVYLSRLTQGPSGNRPRVIFGLELVGVLATLWSPHRYAVGLRHREHAVVDDVVATRAAVTRRLIGISAPDHALPALRIIGRADARPSIRRTLNSA